MIDKTNRSSVNGLRELVRFAAEVALSISIVFGAVAFCLWFWMQVLKVFL
jgi:hypothetical protein